MAGFERYRLHKYGNKFACVSTYYENINCGARKKIYIIHGKLDELDILC